MMRTQTRLNRYERGIVEALVRDFRFNPRKAREVVVHYIEVIRALGGYDNCEEHAERLIQALEINYTCEAWLKRIREIERQEQQDRGFPEREFRPDYEHV